MAEHLIPADPQDAAQAPNPAEGLDREAWILSRNQGVGSILRILAGVTRMRIALVAKVTPDSWTACAVYDAASFGLAPGSTLDVAATY